MGKNKYKKNKFDDEEDTGKKKKAVITPELLMDKSNMDFTQFIPLLPEDVLYPPYQITPHSTQALLKILTDLNYLLYLQPKNFWATVTYNISFGRCISSCLSQMSVRWLNRYRFRAEEEDLEDFEYRMVKDTDAYMYMEAFEEVLLKLMHRIMAFAEEDPRLNEIYNFGENTINKLNIFSFPKLLELIEIYGEHNPGIIKVISKNYLRTISNCYKYFIEVILPPLIKKIQQNNRDMKVMTDREEFGINYSYKRVSPKIPSPGEEQLKRKVVLIMNYLSFLRMLRNYQFLTEEILDHCFYNFQVHFILENAFYELDAAYKVWNCQGVETRILPLINAVMCQIRDYFVTFFERVDQRLVKKIIKSNTIDAYVKSLQRIFQDYGKRYALGKKGANNRNMTLFKLITKKFDLVRMLEELYQLEEHTKQYELNIQFFIDFKLAIEDSSKQENEYIGEDEPRQQEIQQETQVPGDLNMDDVEEYKQLASKEMETCDKYTGQAPQINNQDKEEKITEEVEQLSYQTPQSTDNLQFLISKKNRQDDYFQNLYMKQQQRFKIEYQDEYDDLVDYDKRPLFMEEPSSDSDTDSQGDNRLKRLVSNEENQKNSQQRHLRYDEKHKRGHKKYMKVHPKQQERLQQQEILKQPLRKQEKGGAKKYKPREAEVKSSNQPTRQKQKFSGGSVLERMVEQQNLPERESFEGSDNQQNRQGDRGGRGRGRHRGRGKGSAHNKNYHGEYSTKGRNQNKNKDYGGKEGGKKYKPKY